MQARKSPAEERTTDCLRCARREVKKPVSLSISALQIVLIDDELLALETLKHTKSDTIKNSS